MSDPRLMDRLKAESAGIIALLVYMAIWWGEACGESDEPPMPGYMKLSAQQAFAAGDIVDMFVTDHIEAAPKGSAEAGEWFVSLQDAQAAASRYCEGFGEHPPRLQRVSEAIRRRFSVNFARPRHGKERPRGFAGIRLIGMQSRPNLVAVAGKRIDR